MNMDIDTNRWSEQLNLFIKDNTINTLRGTLKTQAESTKEMFDLLKTKVSPLEYEIIKNEYLNTLKDDY